MEEISRVSQLGNRIFSGNIFAYEKDGFTYVLVMRNSRKYQGTYSAFISLNKKRVKIEYKSHKVKRGSYSYQSLESLTHAIEHGEKVLEFNNSIDFEEWYCEDWKLLEDSIDKRFWIPWL